MRQRVTAYLQVRKLRGIVSNLIDQGNDVTLTSETMFASPGVPKYKLSILSPIRNRRCFAAVAREVAFDPD